jgi:Fe-S cluster assembly protein SufD
MNVVLAKTETAHAKSDIKSDILAVARDRLPGTGRVADLRRQAFEAYERLGLPHRRIEDWKYTDLRVLMREVLPLAVAPDAAALKRAGDAFQLHAIEGMCNLVLVDGVFAPGLSDNAALEAGVGVRLLRDVLADAAVEARADLLTTLVSDPMISLNAAMVTDGVLVTVADQARLTKPIHIVHVATQSTSATYTRSFVRIGSGAHLSLVESFVAADQAQSYQVNDAVIVWLGDGAELQHVRLMLDAADAVNVSSAIFTIGGKARLNTFNMTTGGGVSRYQGHLTIDGTHSHVETNGVNLLNGRQHGDTTLVMNHTAPDCISREVFRAVLDDRSHSVFQGRINVHQIAQKTDAKMMTRALLLSDEAEASNKPELEIFADDVACGHGATTGALDESLLFYLRARGLSEKAAQALLIQAFVGEAIESIVNDDLRELAIGAAERWLEARA